MIFYGLYGHFGLFLNIWPFCSRLVTLITFGHFFHFWTPFVTFSNIRSRFSIIGHIHHFWLPSVIFGNIFLTLDFFDNVCLNLVMLYLAKSRGVKLSNAENILWAQTFDFS